MVPGGSELRDDAHYTPEPPGPGESVLLRASSMNDYAGRACLDLLPDPNETALLGVSLSGGPDVLLAPWRRYAASLPAKAAIVTTDETTRGATAAAGDGDEPLSLPGLRVAVTSVSGPDDLTGLGIKTSQCLEGWAGDDLQAVVRFDSLTTLLQYADIKRIFQFLHVLVRRIDQTDAIGVFQMDPNAHDEQTLATLTTLFDAIHDVEADGSWAEQ